MKIFITAYKQNLKTFKEQFGIIGVVLEHICAIIVFMPFSTIHQVVKTITPPNDNVNGTLIISYPIIIFFFVMGFLFISSFVMDILDLIKDETQQYIKKNMVKIVIAVNIITILVSIYMTMLPIFIFIWLLTAMQIYNMKLEHRLKMMREPYQNIESEGENRENTKP